MIIKQLHIRNIASLEDEIINFEGEELGNVPMFLICGETGAGKSTILDSICLALYGQTPRMASTTKEELELYGPGATEKSYANDNSQLLRRGTGEGWSSLLFTGNDGKDYEAKWYIHRAHKKAHKVLQDSKRSLRAIDGSYEENRVREVNAKVVELTGLEYDQFCRTVMLAQGEFTKFLKSNRSEKSEILEKLTGTAIYTKIGRKIAERFNSRKNDWELKKKEIEHIHLLPDEEREGLAKECAELTLTIGELDEKRGKIERKRSWLSAFEELKKAFDKSGDELKTLTDLTESAEFKEEKLLVAQYAASADARRLTKEIDRQEKGLSKKEVLMPEIEKKSQETVKLYREAEEVLKKSGEAVNEKSRELEQYNREELTRLSKKLIAKDKVLSKFLAELTQLKGENQRLSDFLERVKVCDEKMAGSQKRMQDVEVPIEECETELASIKKEMEVVEMSTAKAVKEIRAQLKEGDICPVCGEKVLRTVGDQFFESILQPKREARKKVEERLMELKSQSAAEKKIFEGARKELNTLKKDMTLLRTGIAEQARKVGELQGKADFSLMTQEDAEKAALAELEEIEKKSNEIHEALKKADEVFAQLKKLQEEEKVFLAARDKAKDGMTDAEKAADTLKAEIKGDRERLDELNSEIREFYVSHPDITPELISALSVHSDKEMEALGRRIEAELDRLKSVGIRQETLAEQLKAHESRQPDFDEGETLESLIEALGELDKQHGELNQKIGNIKARLEQDDSLRKVLEEKMTMLEKSRSELEKWEGLYNLLGDQNGARFRAVAQSFILQSLLENANLYMQSFTDRYLLTCNPGTLVIMVQDNHKPSAPQPVSILSGGESFMASLSLALALSNLRSGGSGVDMLFIDEGFGTLSADVLGNVMDTLEKLHQIGGRKIGLISHVAEMKERIPVHICVNRESPALSRLTIATSY